LDLVEENSLPRTPRPGPHPHVIGVLGPHPADLVEITSLRRRFIIPVLVDVTHQDPGEYQQVPDEFRRFNFGYAPAGDPDPNLRSMLVEEIRAMRRNGAA